jgi:predicted adenylyl cyclase CyaB
VISKKKIMKNLELKAFNRLMFIPEILEEYYYDTLIQRDTYFKTNDGSKRLKIREEESSVRDKRAYAILYDRPDTVDEKISNYDFYEISDCDQFIKVFGGALNKEIVVEKSRILYLYKNARIHIDTVKELGSFVEIEVVIRNDDDESKSEELMKKIVKMLNISDDDKISVGYREMLSSKKRSMMSVSCSKIESIHTGF